MSKIKMFQVVKMGIAWDGKASVLKPIHLKTISIKHGVESGFVIDKKGNGIKMFYTDKDATYSNKLQKKAYKIRAAPKVLSVVFPVVVESWRREVFGFSGLILKWAYKTQVVDKVGGRPSDDLVNRLKKIRISACDLHSKNVGWINGKTVMIDFGRIST